MAERGGQVGQLGIDGGEPGAGGHDHEGGADEHLGQDDPDHRVGQVTTERPSDGGVRPDDVDQQDAADQRGQGQG